MAVMKAVKITKAMKANQAMKVMKGMKSMKAPEAMKKSKGLLDWEPPSYHCGHDSMTYSGSNQYVIVQRCELCGEVFKIDRR